jgi:hypothetical protein
MLARSTDRCQTPGPRRADARQGASVVLPARRDLARPMRLLVPCGPGCSGPCRGPIRMSRQTRTRPSHQPDDDDRLMSWPHSPAPNPLSSATTALSVLSSASTRRHARTILLTRQACSAVAPRAQEIGLPQIAASWRSSISSRVAGQRERRVKRSRSSPSKTSRQHASSRTPGRLGSPR